MSNSKLDLRRNVLVNGLVTFVASMARKLAGQDKHNGCLDLASAESLLLGVSDETHGLGADTVEDIVDKRVHNVHRLL